MTTTYRIGIDVGGTNTDAALLDQYDAVLAKTKTFTTPDILSGIQTALETVLADSQVNPSQITHAMLGTTQATNAIVERKSLDKVVTLRLAGPTTQAITPLTNWPKDLVDVINDGTYLLAGGLEYDGSEIESIDLTQIDDILGRHKSAQHFAISGVFSPVNRMQEQRVRDYILAKRHHAHVTISSEIGSLSLLERENATILNVALQSVMKNVINGFTQALKQLGVTDTQVYLSQNDGTLMTTDYAQKFPVLTIASGPTNSIRGGVYLTQQTQAIILDIGGTTSDLGMVQNGLPRETSNESTIGGVVTNFRMPDIVSVAIGGGTIVREIEGEIKLGPDSVGHELGNRAKVFGGDTLTLSDIAIRLGVVDFGDASLVADIDESFAQRAFAKVRQTITDAIDLVRVNSEPVNLILVGGGSVVIPHDYDNVANILEPDNYDVANAIGASIAKVSGTEEVLVSFAKIPRHEAIEQARLVASQQAIAAGGDENTLEVVEIEEFPIAYHPDKAVNLRVKVVGDLVK